VSYIPFHENLIFNPSKLRETAKLHSHIGRLYQESHPTPFLLMVQVLLSIGMYLFSSTSITLTVYFNHWTKNLMLLKGGLNLKVRKTQEREV